MVSNVGEHALNYVLLVREYPDRVITINPGNAEMWEMVKVKEELDIIMKAGNVIKTYAVTRNAIAQLEQESAYHASVLKALHVMQMFRDNRNTILNIQRPALNERLILEEM